MATSFIELLAKIKLGFIADALMLKSCSHDEMKEVSISESFEFHKSVFG